MKTNYVKTVLIALVCVWACTKSFGETTPLGLTAVDGNATIQLNKNIICKLFRWNCYSEIRLKCSYDRKNWRPFHLGHCYSVSKGDTLFISAEKKNPFFSNPFSYYSFNLRGGKIAACGDVTSLLNVDGTDHVPTYSFYGLFAHCLNLVKAPELNASKVDLKGYAYMFFHCHNLSEITLGNADLDWSVTFHWMDGVRGCTVTCPLDADVASLKGTILPPDCEINYTVDGAYNENDGVAAKGDSVTYTRKMEYRWGTVVLPFNIEYKQNNGNYKLYYLSGMNNGSPSFTQYKDGENIAAGTPMILKAAGTLVDSTYTVNITSYDTNMSTTIIPQSKDTNEDMAEGWTIDGTYNNLFNQTGMYFIAKNIFQYAKVSVELCAYRAWFIMQVSSAAKTNHFEVDGETTSIDELYSNETSSMKIYSISGQEMSNQKKGQINIVNGKKHLVK